MEVALLVGFVLLATYARETILQQSRTNERAVHVDGMFGRHIQVAVGDVRRQGGARDLHRSDVDVPAVIGTALGLPAEDPLYGTGLSGRGSNKIALTELLDVDLATWCLDPCAEKKASATTALPAILTREAAAGSAEECLSTRRRCHCSGKNGQAGSKISARNALRFLFVVIVPEQATTRRLSLNLREKFREKFKDK